MVVMNRAERLQVEPELESDVDEQLIVNVP